MHVHLENNILLPGRRHDYRFTAIVSPKRNLRSRDLECSTALCGAAHENLPEACQTRSPTRDDGESYAGPEYYSHCPAHGFDYHG